MRAGRTSDERGGALGRDNTRANNSSNKRQSLKEKHSGGYRRKDIIRWINDN